MPVINLFDSMHADKGQSSSARFQVKTGNLHSCSADISTQFQKWPKGASNTPSFATQNYHKFRSDRVLLMFQKFQLVQHSVLYKDLCYKIKAW